MRSFEKNCRNAPALASQAKLGVRGGGRSNGPSPSASSAALAARCRRGWLSFSLQLHPLSARQREFVRSISPRA
jgi:hypothetical protein